MASQQKPVGFFGAAWKAYQDQALAQAAAMRAQGDMSRGIVAGLPGGVGAAVKGVGALADAGARRLGANSDVARFVSPVANALTNTEAAIAGDNPNQTVRAGRQFGRQLPAVAAGLVGGWPGVAVGAAIGAGQAANDAKTAGDDDLGVLTHGAIGGAVNAIKPQWIFRGPGMIAAVRNVMNKAPEAIRSKADAAATVIGSGILGGGQRIGDNLADGRSWADGNGDAILQGAGLGVIGLGAERFTKLGPRAPRWTSDAPESPRRRKLLGLPPQSIMK